MQSVRHSSRLRLGLALGGLLAVASLVLAVMFLRNGEVQPVSPPSVTRGMETGPASLDAALVDKGSRPGEFSEESSNPANEPPLEELIQKRDKLRERTAHLRSQLAEMADYAQIVDASLEDPSALISMGASPGPPSWEQRISEQAAVVQKLEGQAAELKKLSVDQFPEAMRLLGIEDGPLSKISKVLQEAKAEDAALHARGVRSDDPKRAALAVQIKHYESTITDSLTAIGRAQSTKLEIEKTHLTLATEKRDAFGNPRDVASKYMETKANYLSVKAEMMEAELRFDAAWLRSMPQERIRDWRRGASGGR